MPPRIRKSGKIEHSEPDYPLCGALGDDIIIEIFHRLPVDSLFRFKSVCKQWNKVISTPYFAHHYRRRHPNPTITGFFFHLSTYGTSPSENIFFVADDQYQNPSLTIEDPHNGFYYDSDKGLILCGYTKLTRDSPSDFFVCNILTGQSVDLPTLSRRKMCQNARLICEGEGADQHFKVIVFFSAKNLDKTNCCKVEVFSSETRRWKERKHVYIPYGIAMWDCSFAHLNGIIYWIYTHGYNFMGAFNVETGHVALTNLPDGCDKSNNSYLRVSSRSLYLTWCKEKIEESDILIWVFDDKDDSANWTLLHTVIFSTLMERNPEVLDTVKCYRKIAPDGYDYTFDYYALAIHNMNPQHIFLKLPGMIVICDLEKLRLEVVWAEEVDWSPNDGHKGISGINQIVGTEVCPFALPAWPIQIPLFRDTRHL